MLCCRKANLNPCHPASFDPWIRLHAPALIHSRAPTQHFDEDFALLLPAIKARHLSPQESRDLIRNEARSRVVLESMSVHKVWEDTKGDRHSPMQPALHGRNSTLPLTRWHELMICQAYLQDFACFGYELPRVCFEHPEVFYSNAGVAEQEDGVAEVRVEAAAGSAQGGGEEKGKRKRRNAFTMSSASPTDHGTTPHSTTPKGGPIPDIAGQISKLAALHGQGVLTDHEFKKAKAKILGRFLGE